MKILIILLVFVSSNVVACERNHWVDEMVKRGDLALTFKPNGDLNSVSCNRKKYTALQCRNANEYVFDYYHKNKKGYL